MNEQPLPKKTMNVLGRTMFFYDSGEGTPIVLLHGNPTSSYLWRNVIPELEGSGRIIAPDLIGMGDSEKIPNADPLTYSFETHRKYLWALLDALIGPAEKIILVIHDWGSALGFHWSFAHRDRVLGIAYMEGIVRPYVRWSEWNAAAIPIFQGFRSDKGEEMILDKNLFIERVLPGSIRRKLSDKEMAEYRRPFLKREDRWPTLSWPRQLPIEGEPSHIVELVNEYSDWMAQNEIPKLFINAEPGAILTGAVREFCRAWKNQTEATVKGLHFIQEDSGPEIGRIVAAWINKHALSQLNGGK
jgi:haloalkane dehalogenase